MPHDVIGKEIKNGDIVSFRARVVEVTPGDTGHMCNVKIKALHSAPGENSWQGPDILSACQLEIEEDE